MQKQQQQQRQLVDETLSSAVSFCPSFNSYAAENSLASVAARVRGEFQDDGKLKSKLELELESKNILNEKDEEEDDDDGEFEFVSAIADLDSSNRLFFDGQIRQVFPVFNRNLLLNDDEDRQMEALKKLFTDDDDDDDDVRGRRASSSDEDEPEGDPSVSFCIWSPSPKRSSNPTTGSSPLPLPLPSPSRCKKSHSTGSSSSPSPSKKWFKLRDLLKRCNSDGKDSFVFLNKPKSNSNDGVADSKEKKVKPRKEKSKAKATAAVSAHEAFYVKNRAIKEGDRKRSYLPYRQDLLGVFANYHGLGKTFPPSF